MKIIKSILAIAMACSFSLAADITDSSTGVSFPSEVQFTEDGKDYTLDATGVATRKKFFVKVYSVASYIQKGDQKPTLGTIMQGDNAKQLTLTFVRDVSADKARDGYQSSFKDSLSPEEYQKLQGDIDTFLGFINQNISKGDEVILRWTPGGNITMIQNGKTVGDIKSEAFAKALWSLWFGDKSIVNRNDLISQ